ncbi:MAG TPA: amino acid adenylation domain-containing protein, partial [Herpetosiphonaceae bacterium]
VARHESLRTVFAHADEQPVQVIMPPRDVPLPVVDVPAAADDAVVHALVQQAIEQPFDLAQGPLLRVRLVRLALTDQILILALHHIVTDGWSMDVLLRELMNLYRGFVQGEVVSLPVLPIQYVDYAVWQRQWLQGAVLEQQLAYWRQQLAELAPLELPTDRVRPPVFTEHGAQLSFQIPATLSAAVRAVGQRLGATLFMTLLAAFDVLLARWSGQQDIAVGTPIAGRVRPELEDLIGFFVNTLVLRTNLAGQPTFAELVARVRQTALDAYAHQDVPFELVVDAVQPERDLGRTPLFQVMFAVQHLPGTTFDLPDFHVEPFRRVGSAVKFDLALTLTETVQGLQGVCEYRTDLFDAPTVTRLVGHYHTLLTALAADSSQRVSTAPLLTESEQHQLLVDWNASAAPVPQERCLHHLFEAQVDRTPAAIALRCGDATLTYAELNARANQLAHRLRTVGVTRAALVGLCLDRSLELVIGLLAILKAGGAYVPLDPDYPQERLAFMLEDAQLAVLVTQASLCAMLPASHAVTVCVDRDAATIAQQPRTNPLSGVEPPDLAYVIYTSGSTGRPKGTLVEHRQVVNTLWGSQQVFGYQALDVQPWLASVAFDIALFELVNPLLAGGTSVIVRREEILDWVQLDHQLRHCTLLHAVPTLLRQIVQQAAAPYRQMRRIFVGGEAVPPDLLAALPAVFPSAETTVLYGPTEATIICTYYPVARDAVVTGHPIGRPLPNHQVRLYDQNRQLVPVGVVGELYVGGAGVTRGYLQRPELTAEKYVTLEGMRWYRTGDQARYRADGTIAYLGRADDQVKLRGFRIELGEIETVVRQHPAVGDAIVQLVEDHLGQQRLVAYIVGEQGNKGTKEQPETATPASPVATGEAGGGDEGLPRTLREFLAQRLPAYMVPSTFVVLEALPLTPNGKVDRRALPRPEATSTEVELVAPRTPLEELIAGVWATVLRIERVGIHDTFFALGGHSLLATQVISRLRQILGRDLPLRLLFDAPTIAAFAEQIEAQPAAVLKVPLVPVPRDGRPLPLSFAQQRLWFLHQLEPGSTAYHLPTVVRLRGTLDVAALQ